MAQYILTLKGTRDLDAEVICMRLPRMAHIPNLLVGSHGVELTGIAPGSKAGSIATKSFIVKTVSVQGTKTPINNCFNLLEKAHENDEITDNDGQ